jgi:hypothetical protein
MLLATPILVFLALVPLAGGRLSALVELQFRRPWLLWAALALQVVMFMPGGPAWPAAHLSSYALAGAFVWHNRRIPYLWLLCLGGALNLAAITANGGTMPASPTAEAEAGLIGTDPANSAVLAHPHLAFLGDVFAIPASWPLHNVFSVGDVVLVVGAGLLIHRVTGSRLLPRAAAARGRGDRISSADDGRVLEAFRQAGAAALVTKPDALLPELRRRHPDHAP